MNPKIVLTEDGSYSLFNEALDEHYHSTYGALQESTHVFINAGIRYKVKNNHKLDVLEIGFGTGLNALLTALFSEKENIEINYVGIEKYPLPDTILSQLNFCQCLEVDKCSSLFDKIHQVAWETKSLISTSFSLTKKCIAAEELNYNNQFDVIYFDAFAPSAQPELWTETIFAAMFKALRPNGILITYCAKGSVKRALKSVGFNIEALPGPIGKREITRAIKLVAND